jgi:hypothetical protein
MPGAAEIGPDDFTLAAQPLETALDLIAICDRDAATGRSDNV